MNGYSKPIINPYKNTVPAPKKENKVETVVVKDKVNLADGPNIKANLDMPMKDLPVEKITPEHPATVNTIDIVNAIAEEAAKNAE